VELLDRMGGGTIIMELLATEVVDKLWGKDGRPGS
jgi:hypothetical protein